MSNNAVKTVKYVLRLWFGFQEPVSRRAYAVSGFSLLTLKYGVEATVLYTLGGQFWSPAAYLSPFWSRFASVELASAMLVAWVLACWSIPFVWIGASMTARRLRDAGISQGFTLLFFVPLVNYVLLLLLCFLRSSSSSTFDERFDEKRPFAVDGDLGWAVVTACLIGFGVLTASLSFGDRTVPYAYALFLAGPFVMGFVAAFLYDRSRRHALLASVAAVQIAVLVLGGLFLLAGLEGLICLAMAYPGAGCIALLGGLLGRQMAHTRRLATTHMAILAVLTPAMPILELQHPPPPLREVVSSIEIDATPEEIWPHLIAFTELPEPSRLFFRLGIAYPQRARIEGQGVGATRYCEFSTGAFVEPITRWDEPSRLSFDVAAHPPTMHEWSPYKITPPHVTNSFHSRRGEFRLTRLGNGRTLLERSTWYDLDLYPQFYWALCSDALLHAIHNRVLDHIRDRAEAPH